MRLRRLLFALAVVLAALPCAVISSMAWAQGPQYSSALWGGMHYRLIGPFRGGRVTAVAGVPSQPNTFYFGSSGGGVWKTTNAGYSWTNVSDGYFAVSSMGALAVADSDPNVVYAGTGSAAIRSNVSIGHGIYKSTDAGKSWSFIGLRDVGQIAVICVDPSDANLVYVAAQGDPFADGADRGVYRSRDGGATWQKVLYASPALGATALAMDPANAKTLYASLWHGLRKPWTIISGSEASAGAGIYKSTDGGDHWTKLGGGLPEQLFGKSNLAISPANPERVYALIEAKPGSGLYRSEDAGATWTRVNAAANLITRPFYYDTLGVDPNNADVVYVGDEGWYKSSDGGHSFRTERVPHGDNHALWINPKNSLDMIQANDGGANVSLDGGQTWSSQLNQPTAEIYQVAVDNQYPYRVYGAQQDDETVIIPSLPLGDNQPFRTGPGCETGPIIPSPLDPNVVYGGCKGQFSRLNLHTHNEQQYWIGAQSLYGNGGKSLIYRFQRVSPMEVSPHDPHVVYYGSQYVHRSRDGGVTWQTISPDLTADPPGTPQDASGTPITRDATGEEIYSVIYSIRESPVEPGVIWTGSNDGLIYVTRDNGKSWKNVTPAGLPPGGRVQNLEPSPHRAATAYAAIYRYLLGDFAPYLYRTDDFGAHWTRLTDGHNGIAADEPTRVVREDPVRAGLLYAGTEFGMYVSFDNGGHWQPFQLNLPVTPVTDIKLAHGDLILSTQGRSDWILDDLGPLRQLTPAVAAAQDYLYVPETAVRSGGRGGFGFGRGPAGPEYPAVGAMIGYYLKNAPSGDLKLEILNAQGQVIRTITSAAPAGGRGGRGGSFGRGAPARLDKAAGMHRFTWDLRYPGPWQSAAQPEGPNGPTAVPGRYQVRLSADGWSQTQPLTLIEDPRNTADGVTTADLQEQFDHNLQVRALVSQVNQLVARVRAAQRQPPAGADPAKIAALAELLITPAIRYSRPGLQTQITYLYGMDNNSDQKIGRDAITRLATLQKQLAAAEAQAQAALGNR
ncbi:MAG TPA: hypothetical protein VNF74_04430 [Terriglobales bacterium]|nr:hypothetical protein [Terriglobales bacterium]